MLVITIVTIIITRIFKKHFFFLLGIFFSEWVLKIQLSGRPAWYILSLKSHCGFVFSLQN